jgi:hypothetical protein
MAKIDVLVEVTMQMTLQEAKTVRRALAYAPEDEVPGVNQMYYEITVALEKGGENKA